MEVGYLSYWPEVRVEILKLLAGESEQKLVYLVVRDPGNQFLNIGPQSKARLVFPGQ